MKTIRLEGVVGFDILASDIADQLRGESEVKLIVNSGGGDVTEGFSIYNLLNDFQGHLTAQVDFAASMASVFIMAANVITMRENSSIMMIHRPWGVNGGNAEDLRRTADTLDKMETMLMGIYMGRSGIEEAELSAMLAAETWLSAEEAKEIGFIDQIEGGAVDMAMVAMCAMRAQSSVNFDQSKFLAKIDIIQANAKPVSKQLFNSANSLADIEGVVRKEFGLSRSHTTAIVAAVKRVVHGEREREEVVNMFNSFNLKVSK